jgi:hypothetical protein
LIKGDWSSDVCSSDLASLPASQGQFKGCLKFC